MIKKLLILLICLIVQKYGYCQNGTTLIKDSTLAAIATDIFICETSLSSCQDREVFYLQKIVNFETDLNLISETLYYDSILIEKTIQNNTILKEENKNYEFSTKNLEKSNKLLKLISISETAIILTALLLLL